MSRARSATFTASIFTWAAAVQPGSPAPLSPSSPRLPSTPATGKSVYTPTSAHQFDLTALGYTSVFVKLPTTPSTPHLVLNNNDNNSYPTPAFNLAENNYRVLDNKDDPWVTRISEDNKPFVDITPASPSHASRPTRNPLAGVFSSRKRSKSMSAPHHSAAKASKRQQHAQLPPALMNELLLLQFTSGGKLEHHIARAVEKGAVADGKGGVWWDEQEQMEYEALVPKQTHRASGKDKKKRPAPLNLAQQEFFDSAYIPVGPPPSAPIQKKSGKMNVRAFFSRAG